MIRFFIPAALMAAVMSAIYLLPPLNEAESAMDMKIEPFIGAWETRTYPPSELEINILAKDTEFSKAHCFRRRLEEMSIIDGVPVDRIDLSIVLSGHDLATSIHRPERCMPAQGHRSIQGFKDELELGDGKKIPVMRLLSKQGIGYGPPEDRQFITRDCLTYYFFVGEHDITRDHTKRTLIDIKDRVLHGKAQRWAYISATMAFSDSEEREFGGPPNFEMADRKIRQLLRELADSNIAWDQINS
ncbi:exosortase-associated EpsI family protein [Haloferula sp. A504]|uniref:exosortase-associated EpsI family protein n=1 Tax=Haloferula sp. A504 TaxID=3373601 RepID=UPI0031C8CF25|nr:EpsI family protein [Verrucomicrobiaceae bacterium E54]